MCLSLAGLDFLGRLAEFPALLAPADWGFGRLKHFSLHWSRFLFGLLWIRSNPRFTQAKKCLAMAGLAIPANRSTEVDY
jgi:hypothetical protein